MKLICKERLDKTSSSSSTSLTDNLPQVPELTPTQWGQFGAGAALALVGSGLLSLGTVVRLAAIVGGGALAYRTWQDGARQSGTAATDYNDSPLPTASSLPSNIPAAETTGLGSRSDFPVDSDVGRVTDLDRGA